MTMIDNVQGFGSSIGNETDGEVILFLNDNYFYGETEIPDCPDPNTDDYCIIVDK